MPGRRGARFAHHEQGSGGAQNVTPAVTPVAAARRTDRRIVGVDVARAFALIGMFSVHILPTSGPDGSATTADVIASGRSAALFAVLAGAGIALATGGTHGLSGERAHLVAAAGLVTRAVIVGVLGLLLVELGTPVAVILSYYALLFVVAIPLLRLPVWALASLAVVWCVAAPVVSHLLRAGGRSGPSDQPGIGALGDPVHLFVELSLTGYYPVLPWITYLLVGLAVGRIDLRQIRTAVGLLVTGVVLAVGAWVLSSVLLDLLGGAAALGGDPSVFDETRYGTTPTGSWWWLAVPAAHSSTPIDLAHTVGTALAVLGASLLLARAVRSLGWLLGAIGAIPLTLYTAHVVGLAINPGQDLELLLWHLAATTLVAVLIRLIGGRGPLEAVVAAASRGVRRAVSAATRSRDGPEAER